jgi:hypothetical protein
VHCPLSLRGLGSSSGPGGRWFKSTRLDHLFWNKDLRQTKESKSTWRHTKRLVVQIYTFRLSFPLSIHIVTRVLLHDGKLQTKYIRWNIGGVSRKSKITSRLRVPLRWKSIGKHKRVARHRATIHRASTCIHSKRAVSGTGDRNQGARVLSDTPRFVLCLSA